MEKLKELFTNSRLGLGAAIGATTGYLMGSPTHELDGIFAVTMVVCIFVVIAENIIIKGTV